MTDRMINAEPQPEPPVGLVEGETVLVNDRMRGLTGVFVRTIVVEGLPTRYRVKVTAVGKSSHKLDDLVSDWARNWRVDDALVS